MAKITFSLAACIMISAACFGQADDELVNEYYQALADYFIVPVENVAKIQEQGIAHEDLPVLFVISGRAKVPAEDIVGLRLQEKTWAEITTGQNLKPDIFYFIVSGKIDSKTYAPIFDKFKMTPEQKWELIELSDDDIVNLVNLKVIGSHYDYSVFEIMALRDLGKDFVQINNQVRVLKEEMIKKEKQEEKEKAKTGNK